MIEIVNLTKQYGDHVVLNNISETIAAGEKVAIVGPSGGGKSTLLRCLNCMEEPTSGEVHFDGKLVSDLDPYLHDELIVASNTFKKVFAKISSENPALNADEAKSAAIFKIRSEKLLRKNEGSAFKKAFWWYILA